MEQDIDEPTFRMHRIAVNHRLADLSRFLAVEKSLDTLGKSMNGALWEPLRALSSHSWFFSPFLLRMCVLSLRLVPIGQSGHPSVSCRADPIRWVQCPSLLSLLFLFHLVLVRSSPPPPFVRCCHSGRGSRGGEGGEGGRGGGRGEQPSVASGRGLVWTACGASSVARGTRPRAGCRAGATTEAGRSRHAQTQPDRRGR